MKKILPILLFIIALLILSPQVKADETEVQAFFEKYVAAANSYAANLPSYYVPDAKIIRIVEKPDGTQKTIEIPTDRYFKEMKSMRSLARIRGYKNTYSDRTVTPEGNDYKLSASRTPKGDKVALPSYFIIGKDSSGAYKIKTESMHTKSQAFLKYTK